MNCDPHNVSPHFSTDAGNPHSRMNCDPTAEAIFDDVRHWQSTLTYELRRRDDRRMVAGRAGNPHSRMNCDLFVFANFPVPRTGNPHSRMNCDFYILFRQRNACSGNPHSRMNCDSCRLKIANGQLPGNPHSRMNCDSKTVQFQPQLFVCVETTLLCNPV